MHLELLGGGLEQWQQGWRWGRGPGCLGGESLQWVQAGASEGKLAWACKC